jgi:chromate transporter
LGTFRAKSVLLRPQSRLRTVPELLIIPLIHYAAKRAEHPRARGVLQAVVLSNAGLLWAATLPIARAAITDSVRLAILLGSIIVLATRKVESLWVILAAALVKLAAVSIGLVSALWSPENSCAD